MAYCIFGCRRFLVAGSDDLGSLLDGGALMILTTQQAIAARDFGMELANQKASKDDPRWTSDAMSAVYLYCMSHQGQEFLTEDIRAFCEELDLADMPSNLKAWGPIMRKAAKDGLIRKVGYAQARSSNMAPKVLWSGA